MPVLATSASDVTAVVRIAAQALPATPGAPPAKASSSGSRSIGGSAVGAIVRASKSSAASSPSTAITYRVRTAPVITVYPDGVPKSFTYNGIAQTYVVPEGVTRLFVEMWGAGGAATFGGCGAYLDGYLPVIPGEILKVIVGRGGTSTTTTMDIDQGNQFWRGGGFSGIFRGSTHLVIVGAGGGGGLSATYFAGGGGLTKGIRAGTSASGAERGTQTAGGTNPSRSDIKGALYRGDGVGTSAAGGSGYYGGAASFISVAGQGDYWSGSGGSSYYTLLEYPWGGVSPNRLTLTPNTKSPRYMTGVAAPYGNGLIWITPIYSPTISPRVISGLFEYTGTIRTYKVPTGVTKLHVLLWGAGGGGKASRGGTGSFLEGILTVTSGDVLSVIVGKGGALTAEPTTLAMGGGGPGIASGGGFSAIITDADYYMILAPGGGGGGSGGQGGTGGNVYQLGQNGAGTGGGFGGDGGMGDRVRYGGVAGGDGTAGSPFTGGAGGLGTGAGGGGGWMGGGGASSTGIAGGGGGGSLTISTQLTTTTIENDDVSRAPGDIPNGVEIFYYKQGIGASGVNRAGGNGMVVIFPLG